MFPQAEKKGLPLLISLVPFFFSLSFVFVTFASVGRGGDALVGFRCSEVVGLGEAVFSSVRGSGVGWRGMVVVLVGGPH